MCRIGVAGYMGAGKSTVARQLVARGYHLIDGDSEAKRLMMCSSEIRKRIAESFGQHTVGQAGILFGELGKSAFSSRESLERLNGIVHPLLVTHLQAEVTSRQQVVLDAALIPLWGIESWFDVLIWVRASLAVRLDRIMRSTKLDEQSALERARLQASLFPEPSDTSWIIIQNDATLQKLHDRIDDIVKRLDPGEEG